MDNDTYFLERLNKNLFPASGFFASNWNYDDMSNEIGLNLCSACGAVVCQTPNSFDQQFGCNDDADSQYWSTVIPALAERILHSPILKHILSDVSLGEFRKSDFFTAIINEIVFPYQLQNFQYMKLNAGDAYCEYAETRQLKIMYLDTSHLQSQQKICLYGEIPAVDEFNFDFSLSESLAQNIATVKEKIMELCDGKIEDTSFDATGIQKKSPPSTIPGILTFLSWAGLDNVSGNSIYLNEEESSYER